MWDKEAVARYEAWFLTSQGAFALEQEKRLIARQISGWPRRNQRLLEVGCGIGLFLNIFWEAGFDATGLDISPAMIAAARSRVSSRVDLHLGSADHLPFDDNEFDFVALLTVLEFLPDPALALQEAVRVARKGLLIAFLNKYSLYYLAHGLRLPLLRKSPLRTARWFTPQELRCLLDQTAGPRQTACSSVLPGPMFTWRNSPPWRWLNRPILPGSLGAWCALRVELQAGPVMTPLVRFSVEPRMTV